MVVAHNLAAMNSQRQYSIVDRSTAKSMEKLSSGYKINRAADDAAGLAISEKMRRQIRGLTQGVENTQNGVSMCQVGDGALAEVSDMIHRITELAVKSANGTLDRADRHAVQLEINQILDEIDKIGNNTDFNGIPLFKGKDTTLRNADGTPYSEGSIPFGDISLTSVDLGLTPLTNNARNTPALKAVVTDPASIAYGHTYNLIFGNGNTSHSSIRVTDLVTNVEKEVALSDFKEASYSYNGIDTWTKTLTYTQNGLDISWIQTIKTEPPSADNKNYIVDYKFINNSANNIELDFMFHADTAYNNNDRCEGYYISGNRVNEYSVYSNGSASIPTGNSKVDYSGLPTSFSIVDVDKALPFTEKIDISGAGADALSIGHYNSIDEWSYYDDTSLTSNLGTNSYRTDLGFSLIWSDKNIAAGGSWQTSFKYGIQAVNADPNVAGVPVQRNSDPVVLHDPLKQIWIQSGTEVGDGMYLNFREVNSEVLNLVSCDVTTQKEAEYAINQTKDALRYISNVRSEIGAQQNRLEHTISNESNIVENTQAAESSIRDTDMAAEMVKFSNNNILAQAGQAMMAQANQSNQGVLAILS